MTDKDQYILSLYENVSIFSSSKSDGDSLEILVKNINDGKIYLKKIIKQGDFDMFLELKKLSRLDSRLAYIEEVLSGEEDVITIERYIDCASLESVIPSLDEKKFRFVISELLGTLETLSKGNQTIVHRDIRPENILVDDELKKIYLVNFKTSGSYEEGAKREKVLEDIYGVGATMKYILEKKNITFENEKEKKHINDIIKKATSVELNDRYQTPQEMLTDLNNETYEENVMFEEDVMFEEKSNTAETQSSDYDLSYDKNMISSAEEVEAGKLRASKDNLSYDDSLKEDTEEALEKIIPRIGMRYMYKYNINLPPGFRDGDIVHMLIAIFGYAFMLVSAIYVSMKAEGNFAASLTGILIMLVLSTLFLADYQGVKQRLRFVLKDKTPFKFLSQTIIVIGIIILGICVSMILEQALKLFKFK